MTNLSTAHTFDDLVRARTRALGALALLSVSCAPAAEAPPLPCGDTDPVHVSPGDVDLITHTPAGSATVRGTVVRSEGTSGGYELDVDVAGVTHTFVVGGGGNGAPVDLGNTVEVAFTEVIDASSIYTDLAVEDDAGHLVAVFVRASGDHDVSRVVTETAARFGVEASARRLCLTSGGACGRRGARYQLVAGPRSARGYLTTADGLDLEINTWQLEDDDTAEWSGAATCETPPRSSISIEARAFAPLGPPPVACAAPPALALGTGTSPVGAPAIEHTPVGSVSGSAIVVSIDASTGPLVIVLDVGGVEHSFTVPLATEIPALIAGTPLWVDFTGDRRGSSYGGEERLLLRPSEAAPALAVYVRAGGLAWFDPASLEDALDVSVSVAAACRVPTGGQCGRGVIVRALTVAGEVVHERETIEVARGSSRLRVAVHALADDSDAWPEGGACAIGAIVASAIDAVEVAAP